MKTVRAIEKQAATFAIYDSKKQKSNLNLNRESGSFVLLQLTKAAVQRMSLNMQNGEDLYLARKEMSSVLSRQYERNEKYR